MAFSLCAQLRNWIWSRSINSTCTHYCRHALAYCCTHMFRQTFHDNSMLPQLPFSSATVQTPYTFAVLGWKSPWSEIKRVISTANYCWVYASCYITFFQKFLEARPISTSSKIYSYKKKCINCNSKDEKICTYRDCDCKLIWLGYKKNHPCLVSFKWLRKDNEQQ